MLTSVIHQTLSSLCTHCLSTIWPTSNCSRLSIRPIYTVLLLLSLLMSNRCPDITYVDCHGNSHWGYKQSKLCDVRPPLLAQSPCWLLRTLSVTQLHAGYHWLANAAGTCHSVVCLEYMAVIRQIALPWSTSEWILCGTYIYYRCRYLFWK